MYQIYVLKYYIINTRSSLADPHKVIKYCQKLQIDNQILIKMVKKFKLFNKMAHKDSLFLI